jgi:phage terminase small subunit
MTRRERPYMTGNVQTTEQTELTPKQDTLITALLTPLSITAAALAAGVSEKTARRWLKLPHFQQAYKAAQKQLFNQALTTLMSKVDKAIDTLDRNMDGELVPASTQVRAAQIWLEMSVNMYKTQEIEEKIAELERIVKMQANGLSVNEHSEPSGVRFT